VVSSAAASSSDFIFQSSSVRYLLSESRSSTFYLRKQERTYQQFLVPPHKYEKTP